MRILVVTTSYPAAPGDASGHFVRAHARALAAAHAAEVVVVAPGAMEPARAAASAGAELVEAVGEGSIRVVRTGGEALFGWPGATARAREQPLRLLAAPLALARATAAIRRAGPFDHAVAHWLVPSGFPLLEAAPLAAASATVEVLAHGGDVRLLCAAPPPVRAAVVRRLLDRALVRFVARALRDDLAAGLPPDLAARLRAASAVEPAPIDVPERGALPDPRAALGLRPGEAYVAWVGRLVAGKRPRLGIEAARAAGLPIVVVGDGPEHAALTASPRLRGQVVLAGRLPRDAALAVVASAAALLHTSSAEGAPTVVREARTLRVPVVACASGDLAAWAAVDPGIVLAADAPAALGAALREVVAAANEAA